MQRRAKTTLILGAGASVPYGFPTGPDLAQQIIAGLRDGDKSLYVQLHQSGFAHDRLHQFTTRLINLQTYSIDRFLEAQPSLRDIGCAAIAAALIPREASHRLTPREGHWYQYLFNELLQGERYEADWLRVLTFNYDRSLEEYLFGRLVHGMGWAEEEAARLVCTPHFFHLHGQLGQLPWWSSGGVNGLPCRPYRDACDSDVITSCARGIRVVGDPFLDAESAFEDAHQILRRSDVICFIGFGYHTDSLRRLSIPEISPSARLFGTAYGLPERRRTDLKSALPGIELGRFNEDTIAFLDRTGALQRTSVDSAEA